MKPSSVQVGDEVRFYDSFGGLKRTMKVDAAGKALSVTDYNDDNSYEVRSDLQRADKITKHEHFYASQKPAHLYYEDEDGKRVHEEKKWYENGEVEMKCRYGRNTHDEPIRVGDYYEGYESGKPKIVAHCDAGDGEFSDHYIEYWQNGNVKKECHYGRSHNSHIRSTKEMNGKDVVNTIYFQILNYNYYEGHGNGMPSLICRYAVNGQRNSPLYMYDAKGNPTYEIGEKNPKTETYLHKMWKDNFLYVSRNDASEPYAKSGRWEIFKLENKNTPHSVVVDFKDNPLMKSKSFFKNGKNISAFNYYSSHLRELFKDNSLKLADKDLKATPVASVLKEFSIQPVPAN